MARKQHVTTGKKAREFRKFMAAERKASSEHYPMCGHMHTTPKQAAICPSVRDY